MAAIGLAIDGSDLYAQRQAAQAAADAAAQAGIMSIFDGTNTDAANAHGFTATAGTTYTCTSPDPTPCYYAETLNGFNKSGDTVTYTPNPAGVSVPNLSGDDPVNLLQVTVQRNVPATLMRLLGWNTIPVKATGTAAIVQVMSPVPIIITHPTMAGALNMNGTTSITICGGPQRSIQVNSNDTTDPANNNGYAFLPPSSGSVNLLQAGPNDPGDCSTSNGGGDFGTFGGPPPSTANAPSYMPSGITPGPNSHYISPASPIADPLADVYPDNWAAGYPNGGPPAPSNTPPQNGQSCSILGHCGDCPALQFVGSPPATCTEYLPGVYSSLSVNGVNSAIFDPGLYYVEGGDFTLKNTTVQMCSSCTPDANTAMGMVVYNTGTPSNPTAAGRFIIDTNTYATLWGGGITVDSANKIVGAPAAPYYGILFFENRHADAHNANGNGANAAHTLGAGNGCFSLIGTVYITNTLDIMKADPTHYQGVTYHGTPCSSTENQGEIIASELTVVGTSGINMTIFPNSYLKVRQVALVQ